MSRASRYPIVRMIQSVPGTRRIRDGQSVGAGERRASSGTTVSSLFFETALALRSIFVSCT